MAATRFCHRGIFSKLKISPSAAIARASRHLRGRIFTPKGWIRTHALPEKLKTRVFAMGTSLIGLYSLLYAQAAPLRNYGLDEAMDMIKEQIQEFRDSSSDVKWPGIKIKAIPDDEKNRRYFRFSYEPGVRIEDIISAIVHPNMPEMMVIPPESKSERGPKIRLKNWDGTFQVIIDVTEREVVFEKTGHQYFEHEINAIVNSYKIGNKNLALTSSKLSKLGLKVYQPSKDAPSWGDMAGYEDVKKEIQNSVIHALKHPQIYEKIMQQTRKKNDFSRPKAILFEGPPGTGKTTAARIIAAEIDVPMVYVPVESVVGMWYGESEKMLAKVFDTCESVGRSIVFIDEIDSLATSRGPRMHEATRRLLSTLLRRIEGFDRKSGVMVIGATNRKGDLDEALLSRFDTSIRFKLPNANERGQIFAMYAKQLSDPELNRLAEHSDGFSGRDIRDTCAHAERDWGATLIEGNRTNTPIPTPPFEIYVKSLEQRKVSLGTNQTASIPRNKKDKGLVEC
ncbi:hypothetical protein AAMO2058_001323800 [Amorphochlora amoebiformis]